MTPKEEKIWNKFWNGVEEHNYNTLTKKESEIIRKIHLRDIRTSLPFLFDKNLNWKKELPENVLLNGYSEYVVGDHGVYIEFSPSHCKLPLVITKGEEYRLSDKYLVKYYWFNPFGFEKIKVYLQRETVEYADYKIGYYYVSPYDIFQKVKEKSLF